MNVVIILNLILLMFFALSFSIYAENTQGNEKKTKGIGFNIGYASFSENNMNGAMAVGLNFFCQLSEHLKIELKGSFIPGKTETDPNGLSDGTLNVIPLQLSLFYCFNSKSKLNPYLGAGGGYYLNNFTIKDKDQWQSLGFNVSEKVNGSFGFHLAVGTDYFISPKLALNADLRYCIAKYSGDFSITEEITGISNSREINGDLNFILFGVGIKYTF